MTPEELKRRTKSFALAIIDFSQELPKHTAGQVIARQILRSGTSVAANYRASCRARSKADFASKLGITEEEADETAFWLELLRDSNLVPASRIDPLWQEADELTRILHASRKKANQRES